MTVRPLAPKVGSIAPVDWKRSTMNCPCVVLDPVVVILPSVPITTELNPPAGVMLLTITGSPLNEVSATPSVL